MKAKFIGKTCGGFKSNTVYDINTKIIENHICIYDCNSENWCPYNSLESVLVNWEFLLEV